MSYPRIADYMSSPVVAVRPGDSLAHARRLMIRHRVGRLVVVDEAEKPVGVVTKADFLKLASRRLRGRPLDSIPVAEVMTREPVVAKPGWPLREAARLMLQHGIGGLPVVGEDGRLVGIITKTDVVRAYAERLRGRGRAGDYMYSDAPRASPSHSLAYVVELLEGHPSRRVLVVDGGRLVGIIAPSDIAFASPAAALEEKKRIRRFAELPKGRLGPVYEPLLPTAEDVMTRDPVSVAPESDLAEAAGLMIEHGFSSVPVVEEGAPLGVVVKHNILRAI
ncbi:hypothetical protein CF15_05110 [Pyrodictium occultum]|uniref:CBS domain-containing protein n=1 Tax=Pyrodictium occultum TaxID=2309 RepID=A0A0V8RVT2_PYROC|nr:CBS domain-containing protein [Pyrodictium occultum]KSW12145.1 hypothetical protein CF15_05110 [Pyrodictium occultum]